MDTTSILFVCLGNICRSPLAEGIFRHRAAEAGVDERFLIDSAGTADWHTGRPPDPRSQAVAATHGVSLAGQRARPVVAEDFDRFDWIVAMDRTNKADLADLQGRRELRGRLILLRDLDPDPGDGDVPDPYYGGPEGFDEVFAMIDRACVALLEHVERAGRDEPVSR